MHAPLLCCSVVSQHLVVMSCPCSCSVAACQFGNATRQCWGLVWHCNQAGDIARCAGASWSAMTLFMAAVYTSAMPAAGSKQSAVPEVLQQQQQRQLRHLWHRAEVCCHRQCICCAGQLFAACVKGGDACTCFVWHGCLHLGQQGPLWLPCLGSLLPVVPAAALAGCNAGRCNHVH